MLSNKIQNTDCIEQTCDAVTIEEAVSSPEGAPRVYLIGTPQTFNYVVTTNSAMESSITTVYGQYMCSIGDGQVLRLGGSGDGDPYYYNETWLYDYKTNTWTKINTERIPGHTLELPK